ncbi:MAG TPA: DUF502 domain-containing protein [Candidatus Ozemobacteraceae bacterium]|nr:DUF502 domain-containing protein [Candidatus Ozemobacteraceae bacterium]
MTDKTRLESWWLGVVKALTKPLEALRNAFITGVIVAVPIAITVYIAFLLFLFADGILGDAVADFMGYRIPGVGLILTILLFVLTGLVAQNVIGNRLVRWLDASLEMLPFVRPLYVGVKQVSDILFKKQQWDFQRVVMVEYPKSNSFALGFITGDFSRDLVERSPHQDSLVCVFVPTTPNPTSGFMLLVPKDKIYETRLSIEEAMKLIISGGLVKPGFEHPPANTIFEDFTIPH